MARGTLRLVVAILLGFSLSSRVLVGRYQQSPPTGLVLGQVVDASTNAPIPRAIVTLTGDRGQARVGVESQGPQRVLADAEGRFLFRDLSKGNYAFSATAPGYLDGAYGQRRPAGAPQLFTLNEGQRVGDLGIRLWRESVIAGAVTDEAGALVPGVTVMIERRFIVNGRLELRPIQYGKRTDDRGRYSQAGIAPGEYVVAVPAGMTVVGAGQTTPDAAAALALRASGADALNTGPAARSAAVRTGDFVILPGGTNTLAGQLPLTTLPNGHLATYVTTFHPSTSTLGDAGIIRIGVGQERTDVDLQLRPVATSQVSGTLLTPDGPAANSAVHLIPVFAAHGPLERAFEAAVVTTDRAGTFIFPMVATGQYVLEAWRMPSRNASLVEPLPVEPSLWAEASITVDAAPTAITLTLRPGAALKGRIVLDGTTVPPRAQLFQAVLGAWFQPPWPMAFNAGPVAETRVTPTFDFMREGVPPGTYFPNIASNFGPPAGWFFKSATLDGRDLLTSPLVLDGQDVAGIEITFTDRPTTLSGLVTDTTGRPDSAAGVLVLPVDVELWLRNGMPAAAARVMTATQTGAYAIPHLPPGSYLIVAANLDALDDWQQPSLVRALAARATRVTLTGGATTRLDLRAR